jgi:hypothetical protein
MQTHGLDRVEVSATSSRFQGRPLWDIPGTIGETPLDRDVFAAACVGHERPAILALTGAAQQTPLMLTQLGFSSPVEGRMVLAKLAAWRATIDAAQRSMRRRRQSDPLWRVLSDAITDIAPDGERDVHYLRRDILKALTTLNHAEEIANRHEDLWARYQAKREADDYVGQHEKVTWHRHHDWSARRVGHFVEVTVGHTILKFAPDELPLGVRAPHLGSAYHNYRRSANLSEYFGSIVLERLAAVRKEINEVLADLDVVEQHASYLFDSLELDGS